jgi:flagellar protein FlaG
MSFPGVPTAKLQISATPDYRENYANSLQVRMSLYDFMLMFGTFNQTTPDSVNIVNFQGVYLSPQNAKILANLLNQHVQQYEATFGEIRLEPVPGPVVGGPVQ